MSNITKPKSQSKRIAPKLKSQIMAEILVPNALIPEIARKYDLSSTTLYNWRSDYNKKLNLKSDSVSVMQNNFIELGLLEESGGGLSSSKARGSISEISLILNDISLSIKGNVSVLAVTKILNCLEC